MSGAESLAETQAEPGTVPIEIELAEAVLDGLSPPRPAPRDAGGDTVGAVMTPELLFVAPEQPLVEVAEQMRLRDVGAAVVVDDERLVGILTSRDLLRAFAADITPGEARACEWMTAEPVAVTAATFVESALALMGEHGIHRVPVVEGDRPVGMLGFRQAVRSVRGRGIGLGF